MTPDDPRHGTTRGYHAGCRLTCCRAAIARYEKASRFRRHNGIVWAIPAVGTQRRIKALMAMGWTTTDIATEAGWGHRNMLFQILKGQKGKPSRWVERDTYRRVAEVYERLSMTIPPHAPHRARARSLALKKGYLPPLAWDDIDDPAAEPWMPEVRGAGNPRSFADTVAEFDFLIRQGESEQAAMKRLGIRRMNSFIDQRKRLEKAAS